MDVVKEIWIHPQNGFKHSDEMREFVRETIVGQREEYITHFEKFGPQELLNFN